jgi:hypothetical protein
MLFTFQTKLFTPSKMKSAKVRFRLQNSGTFFDIHTTNHTPQDAPTPKQHNYINIKAIDTK